MKLKDLRCSYVCKMVLCFDVATLEEMAICIRFVDGYVEDFKVREEFIGFVEMEKLDAATISSAIISAILI